MLPVLSLNSGRVKLHFFSRRQYHNEQGGADSNLVAALGTLPLNNRIVRNEPGTHLKGLPIKGSRYFDHVVVNHVTDRDRDEGQGRLNDNSLRETGRVLGHVFRDEQGELRTRRVPSRRERPQANNAVTSLLVQTSGSRVTVTDLMISRINTSRPSPRLHMIAAAGNEDVRRRRFRERTTITLDMNGRLRHVYNDCDVFANGHFSRTY